MTRTHLECQGFRPTLVAAFQADEPAAADVQRAYLRFSWTRRKVPPRFHAPVLRWLVAGVAIGLGLASAATLVPVARVSLRDVSPAHSSDVVAASPKRSWTRSDPHSVVLPPAVVSAPVAIGDSLPRGAPAVVPQSVRAEAVRSASRVPRSPQSDWEIAAQALRAGNLSLAENALLKLEQSDDAPEREAADLARAQLLASSDRRLEAVAILERLSREGHSDLIRSQATSVLRRLQH